MRQAPFLPDPRFAGKSLAECKRILGGKANSKGAASDIAALWHRQGGRCFWCDRPMVVAPKRVRGLPVMPQAVTIDHILTRSQGGRMGPKVAACFECNTMRGDTAAHDFLLVAAVRLGVRMTGLPVLVAAS